MVDEKSWRSDAFTGSPLSRSSAMARQAELAENWRRRRILLRAMLFLLGLVCAMSLGAAGMLLLLLDHNAHAAPELAFGLES